MGRPLEMRRPPIPYGDASVQILTVVLSSAVSHLWTTVMPPCCPRMNASSQLALVFRCFVGIGLIPLLLAMAAQKPAKKGLMCGTIVATHASTPANALMCFNETNGLLSTFAICA